MHIDEPGGYDLPSRIDRPPALSIRQVTDILNMITQNTHIRSKRITIPGSIHDRSTAEDQIKIHS